MAAPTSGCNGCMPNTIRRCSPRPAPPAPGHSVRAPGGVTCPADGGPTINTSPSFTSTTTRSTTCAALAPLVEERWRSGAMRPVFAGPLRTMISWEAWPPDLPGRRCATYAGGLDIFAEWQKGATELRWRSTTAANDGQEVSVFSRRCGTPGAPAASACPRLSDVEHRLLRPGRRPGLRLRHLPSGLSGLRVVRQAAGALRLFPVRRCTSARLRDHRGVEADRIPHAHPRSRQQCRHDRGRACWRPKIRRSFRSTSS